MTDDQFDNDDVFADEPDDHVEAPTRVDRAKSVAIVTGRTAAGLIGAAIAVVVVGGLTIVPLPRFEAPLLTERVTPVASAEQRVCAGSMLQLANDSGSSAITIGSYGPTRTTTGAIDAELATADLLSPDVTGQGSRTPAKALTVPVTGTDTLVAGAQAQVVSEEDTAGLSASACTAPSADSWIVGGSTATGRTSLLLLGNPTAVAAIVEIEVYGPEGVVATVGGINVPALSQRVLSLASYAVGLQTPVVHVTSTGGQIAASIQQTVTRGLDPGGIDTVGPTRAPARTLVIPGVVISASDAVTELFGTRGDQDMQTVLRLFVPGSDDADVQIGIKPQSADGVGASIPAELHAGHVIEIPIESLADGTYSIEIESSEPVVAAIRVTTAAADAAAIDSGYLTDFAWTAAAQPLGDSALVAVAQGPSPVLHLVNPQTADATVTVTDADGVETTVAVPAGSAVSVPATPGAVLRLGGVAGIYASVSFLGAAQLAGYSAVPAGQLAEPVVVYY